MNNMEVFELEIYTLPSSVLHITVEVSFPDFVQSNLYIGGAFYIAPNTILRVIPVK
jgi:hypothetical protein